MKSKAHIKGHPIHPILVTFPIAFFIGAFIFEILAWNYHDDDLRKTAGFLIIAGIVSALLAAIPGIIDFLYTVPPDSSGKKRAAKHGLTNISVVALFAVSYFFRVKEMSPVFIIGLEGVAVVLLGVAGWMGGTLVYRNQIGVNPRYARAGKWKEEYLQETKDGIEVATLNELEPDQMKLVHIRGRRIVIARTEKGWAAFDDHCTHRGGSLAGGALICGTVQCPWHGSQFDVYSGNVKAGPAKKSIRTYELKEAAGKLILSVKP